MAEQTGIIKLKGTIGDLVFYTRNGKQVVRRKPTVSANKRKNDPSFERVRESNREFGMASKLSACLRQKMKIYSNHDPNGSLNNQLTSALLKMIQQGPGFRGQRVLTWQEDPANLKSVSFSAAQPVDTYLSGKLYLSIENSIINCSLQEVGIEKIPQGADSYKCSFIIIPLPEISFESKKYFLNKEKHPAICLCSDLLPIETTLSQDFNYAIPNDITNNNFLIIQMLQFYQLINEQSYQLHSTPIQIIDILSRS